MLRLTAILSLLLVAFGRQANVNLNIRTPPAEWLQLDRVNALDGIVLHFGLKQQNLDILERTLFEVSDPRSVNYGKHKTFDEINQMIAPKQETVNAVYGWLKENGISANDITFTASRDFLRVETDIQTAERLLATQYYNFEHVRTGYKIVRVANSYSLPEKVRGHIDFVGPTTRFPRMQAKDLGTIETIESIEGLGVVNPGFLRSLYNVGDYAAKSTQTQQCVTGFLEQYVSTKDLGSFLDKFSPATTKRDIQLVGPNVAANPGIEAMLDIEYVMAMGLNVNSTFWYTPGRAPGNKENEPFLQFLFDVSNATNPPQVFSISYGDNEDTVDFDYATRINAEFQKLGARGISFLASSGDGGVGGSQPTSCSKFVPTFPAASPYVTAVGGTTGSTEKAASLSGGGFSNYWDRPSYQTSFVDHYFSVAKNLPNKSLYNNSGAGFPDVSAQAEDFLIVWRGLTTPVSGTSCSSPTFAGVVALLNDVRLAAGKNTLGYLNPLFYQNPDAFNDVTEGSNPGCNTNGFYAAQGWDPVTGLGTPNFQKLSQIVSNLP